MSLGNAIIVYFITWWMVLFITLPFGIVSQEEAGEKIEPGTTSSAPVKPRMRRKLMLTTVIAAGVWAVIYLVITYKLIGLDDIPILSRFG
ncbi:MAG: DUF1467 family protein [Hyphomicrobiales bacterium]